MKTPPSESKKTTLPSEVLNLIYREFKISGQIGEQGQQDRLTFTSLAHHIEAAREKGYRDNDIIRGVIRAIVPGRHCRILRCHYQERDTTDLNKQLAQLAQDPKESAQSFLLKALDLRQKVVFASQEA